MSREPMEDEAFSAESEPETQPTPDNATPSPRTRRQLLTAGTVGAAFFIGNSAAKAQNGSPHQTGLERRLVQRITYGVNPTELNEVKQRGYSGYLEYQLNYTAINDTAVTNYVASTFPALAMSVYDINRSSNTWPLNELIGGMIYRAAFSKRQLYQRMVEFWTDHFNIAFDKVGPLKVIDDREVVRRHALGKFPDLLRASAHSVAMLEYLDNIVSFVGAPNQNYARELKELHTLSPNGGYTQQDVEEVARCFTGWSRIWENSQRDGTFNYYNDWHDTGSKTVLGQTIPSGGGQSDGDTVLNILINHPSTPRFVGAKMFWWFHGSNPSPAQLNAIAQAYASTGGDIKAMLRVILNPRWLAISPPKLKRPFHVLANAVRVLQPTISDWNEMAWWRAFIIGQPPFMWGPPNGYPDTAEYWGNSLLPRWNFVASLASNWIYGFSVNVSRFTSPTSAEAMMNKINTELMGGVMTPAERGYIRRFLDPIFTQGVNREQRVRDAIATALALPSFQMY